MKQRILYLLLFAFLSGGVQTASAQSFWKKLGKAAKGLVEAVGSGSTSSDGSSNSEGTTSSGSRTTTNDAAGVLTYKVTDCLRAGTKGVRVDFAITNSSDKCWKVYVHWVAARVGGQEVECDVFQLGGSEFYRMSTTESEAWIMPHSTLPCQAYFKGVSSSTTAVESVMVELRSGTKTLSGMGIKELPASNVEKCKVTDPDLLLTVKSIRRSGSNVVLTFALKNNSGFNKYFHLGEYEAHDASGSSYKKTSYGGNGLTVGGNQLWNISDLRLLAGASATYELTIENIPTSQTELSLVRIPLSLSQRVRDLGGGTTTRQIWDNFTIDFRNLKINTTY